MKIFDFIKKYYVFGLFLIILVLSIFLFQTCSTLKRERADREYQEKQDEQNRSAMIDSITKVFNRKLQAWEYSKDNYIVQRLEDLEKYNKDLYNELKKVKGDVIAAIKTEVQGNLGGISTTNDLIKFNDKPNHYGLKFSSKYKDSGFEQQLAGTSKFFAIPDENSKKWIITPDVTIFDTNLTKINITYGFKEEKDKYRVFAISSSPKIEITDLTGGYFIDKQPSPPPVIPKKWAIGPYIGFGLNTDPNLSNPRFGWSAGFSIHYDILQWRFGKK